MPMVKAPSVSRTAARGSLCLVLTAVLATVGLPAAAPVLAAGGASFVQQASSHGNGASLGVTLPSATSAGYRLVVEVGVWNNKSATASTVTDDAGDIFLKLLSFAASDHTELSV